jgi:hypothetical protein
LIWQTPYLDRKSAAVCIMLTVHELDIANPYMGLSGSSASIKYDRVQLRNRTVTLRSYITFISSRVRVIGLRGGLNERERYRRT